ncbi:hypothetical protein D9756_005180 [Leucocoprinus leucothites]|uniref:Cytochrome P450 n=1 Tax=Leucocoprinus leucothites TaxID=201217 RepID=A0A8H5LKC2_9AGAR|nr:hypothetical protein D9756_005180 [Leucoagaricus leucothites]
MPALITILDIGLGVAGLLIILKLYDRKPTLPLPPGPRKLPIIGNLFDVPAESQWLTFAKWGNLVSISVFGEKMIIVNSAAVAIDMLEKKGSNYSDRPIIQMGGELVGWKNTLGLLPYGDRLKDYRRLFHQFFGSNASMSRFYPLEEAETHKFLKRLLLSPQDLDKHIRRTAGTIILHISHGYEVKEADDPLVVLANVALEQFSLSAAPGSFLVNLIPAMSWIPAWFPGAKFKITAREWANTLNEMVERPYQYVKEQMAQGTAAPSFTENLLRELDMNSEKEEGIKWSAASMYVAGADTTVSSIYAFFKAMALYPEVAAEAQAEIDSIIGSERLPSFADRKDLPYVNALALELTRWHTVVPTGLSHVAKKDDIHDGFLIPKGTVIIPNIWKMQHDSRIYPDPMVFNPKRFLGPSPEPDPRKIFFGFGRRICPGRVLADSSIFISCAMTLAVFNITKYVDESGQVIEPVVEPTGGPVLSRPTPFLCSIKPRSQKALSLITAEVEMP